MPPMAMGEPLYRSLLPLLLADQSMRTLPRRYSYEDGSCASYGWIGVLRLDSSLFRFPPENDDGLEWWILLMLLGEEASAFCWERRREGVSDDLISFLTLSYISLKISTSFLACMRYAFSLRISIFSILWWAILSSLSRWLFLSFNFYVSFVSLSASALFSFPDTSSLMRPCSACSTAILAIRSAIPCSLTLSLSQNCSCVVKSSLLTLRTPLFTSSPAPFRERCPSYKACVLRKRSCSRAVISAPCCSMRSSRAASWAQTDCECSCSAEWEAEMRVSWWASFRERMVKFLEREVCTT